MSSANTTDPIIYSALGTIIERIYAIQSSICSIEYTQRRLERKLQRICAEMGIAYADLYLGPTEPPPYASSPPHSPQFEPPTPPSPLLQLTPPPPPSPPGPPSLNSPAPASPSPVLPSSVPETEYSDFPDVTDPWQEEDGEIDQTTRIS
ncbi:hypothetical protein AAP_04861 [Ascosphaera apis ARSEF 7405]|uniref:Uncharacterized protein n=1 Tax=Ascosphaera apis ARSEF 7405 TaxID=392613 RepID=A0A167W8V4_9EURO|nr:hypothetical protein AAP_04861 [Ascosphaera apis ARSEF 7405]